VKWGRVNVAVQLHTTQEISKVEALAFFVPAFHLPVPKMVCAN